MDPRSRVIDQTMAVLRQKLRSGRILTRSGHGHQFSRRVLKIRRTELQGKKRRVALQTQWTLPLCSELE